MSCRN